MSYSPVDSLVRALIPAVVLGVFALARRYLPARATLEYASAYSLEDLRGRFAVTQWLVGAAMVLVGAAIALGIHSILVNLNRFFAATDGPSDFVLLPQTAIWWFLPGFAALCLAWEITLGAWSLVGNAKDVALYNYWTTATAGFDSTRVLRIMTVVIVLPIGILTALEVPAHVTLGNEEIRMRGYGFSSAKTYRYRDARSMTIIEGFRNRDGTLVRRAGVLLDFSDGRRWSSADIGDFKPTVDQGLVDFLTTKTGLKPQYAETESDIPRL